ncbi:MAG: AbrB/MazE/SpoVT family DNA-binding domain-containing protein [Caldilineaceae bacterium]
MEQTQQRISQDGLQIPLPFITQYGLHPGSEVTVELDDDVIRIVPKYPNQADIERRALRLLLQSLGDAVHIKADQLDATEPDRQRGD